MIAMSTYYRPHAPAARLLELLRGAHDDAQPELDVRYDAPALVVRRASGDDLSESEEREVRALLAADDAERFE